MSISLAGINAGFRHQINDGKLMDPFARAPGLLGLMTGLDSIYAGTGQARPASGEGVDLRFNVTTNVSGDGLEWSMSGQPMDGEFVGALTAPLDTPVSGLEEAPSNFTAAIPYCYLSSPVLGIRKAEINKWAEKEGVLKNYIDNALQQLAKSMINPINSKLFPANNLSPSLSGGTDGSPSELNLMAFAYPLQTGQANGATTTSTSFSYAGIEIGQANTDLRAVQYGSYSGDTAYTRETFSANIVRPLNNRGVEPDLAISGALFHDKIRKDMESNTVIGLTEDISYGIRVVKIDGIRYYYEPRMDDLTYKEVYVGDSSSLYFAMDSTEDGDITNGSFEAIQHPQSTWMWIYRAGMTLAFANKYPWMWGVYRRPSWT